MKKSQDQGDGPARPAKQQTGSISVYEPMFAWVAMLLIGVFLKVLISSTTLLPQNSHAYAVASLYSSFILQFPGTVILPLIIGAVIGAEVGLRASSMRKALRSGVLNGLYSALVYLIAIIIALIVMQYATPRYVSITYHVILQSIVLPIAVFLVVLEAFAALSHLRKIE